ncbi:hypothetical protein VPH209E381_0067 [Vibrio phage 209E38-1]
MMHKYSMQEQASYGKRGKIKKVINRIGLVVCGLLICVVW